VPAPSITTLPSPLPAPLGPISSEPARSSDPASTASPPGAPLPTNTPTLPMSVLPGPSAAPLPVPVAPEGVTPAWALAQARAARAASAMAVGAGMRRGVVFFMVVPRWARSGRGDPIVQRFAPRRVIRSVDAARPAGGVTSR
jgi:hypothetical protein